MVALRPRILVRRGWEPKVHKYPERLDCVSSDAADNGNIYASGGRLVRYSLSYVTLTVGNRLACRSYGTVLAVFISEANLVRIPRFGH